MIADIVDLNDSVFARTRARLDGLTDNEMFWEPAPGCWTVRLDSNSTWIADGPADGEVGPLTTIAWRLWHLTDCYGSARNAEWLGADLTAADPDPPQNVGVALDLLERAARRWSSLLGALTDDSLVMPLGPVAGPYAESSKLGFVLHLVDEQIHHGAEMGVMRDLYLALGTPR